MEDRGYRGEPDEVTKPKTAGTAEGSFSAWLKKNLRLEADDGDTEKTDDDTEDSKEKKQKKSNKLGAFLRRLLSGSASKSAEQSNQDTQENAARIPLFGLGEFAPQHNDEQLDTEVTEIQSNGEQATQASEELGVLKIEHDEPITPELSVLPPVSAVESNNAVSEQPEEDEEQSHDGSETELSYEAEGSSAHDTQAQSPTEVQPRYYGGNAEPMLRDEIERLKRKTKQQERATKQVKSEAEKAEAQLDLVRKQQKQFEKQLRDATNTAPDKQPEVIQPPSPIKTESSVRSIEQETPTAPVTKETIKSQIHIETASEKTANPPEVLRTVAEAAEKDVPIESQFERRHEIKDEPSTQSVTGGATPISTILQSSVPQYAPPYQVPPAPSAPQQPRSSFDNQFDYQKQRLEYVKAIQYGFLSGLMILAMLALLSKIL